MKLQLSVLFLASTLISHTSALPTLHPRQDSALLTASDSSVSIYSSPAGTSFTYINSTFVADPSQIPETSQVTTIVESTAPSATDPGPTAASESSLYTPPAQTYIAGTTTQALSSATAQAPVAVTAGPTASAQSNAALASKSGASGSGVAAKISAVAGSTSVIGAPSAGKMVRVNGVLAGMLALFSAVLLFAL